MIIFDANFLCAPRIRVKRAGGREIGLLVDEDLRRLGKNRAALLETDSGQERWPIVYSELVAIPTAKPLALFLFGHLADLPIGEVLVEIGPLKHALHVRHQTRIPCAYGRVER